MTVKDSRAIIYLAAGQQYIDEAVRSARSIGGQYHQLLCTPDNVQARIISRMDDIEAPFYDILSLLSRQFDFWYLDYVNYLNIILDIFKYDQFLLLDTDTFVCGDLEDFFTILDRFDIAGAHAIGRETMIQRDDIPLSFPEINTGVLAFKRNQRVKNLFKSWLEIYQSRPEYFGDNDQGPLREALWKDQNIRLAILPNEFHFRYRWGGLVNGQVRILHGRENNTPYEKIAKQVNGTGIRVYKRRELA